MPVIQPTPSLQGRRASEVLREEFSCDHEDVEVRRKVYRNGIAHYHKQCLRCGTDCGSVPKSSSFLLDIITPFDEGLSTAWWQKRSERYQELAQVEKYDWYAEHDSYLDSAAWRSRRQRVLERAGGLCEGCRQQRATEVHHLTYSHWQHELLFQLVALCRSCHQSVKEGNGWR